MRTNIEIDDQLMAEALELSGQKTKRAAVEEALRLMIKLKRQKEVAKLFGKLKWEGDLEQSRLGRLSE
jgi:Arc/MetJ family transcription regulator